MVLDKLLGGERKPFLVLSEESNTDVVIAPTRPEEPEADEASAALEAPILFAQGVAPAQPAAAQAKPAATKSQPAAAQAQPESSPAQPEKALTTAELLAAQRATETKAAPVRSTETFAAELLNPANVLPRRRRRPGAALAGFKEMVGNLSR
ncbi:MAG TPA: hypothetical protein DEO90_08395 [Synechococcales bacterium UBA8647]|nr:hypothetical protein [Synechococcales bacterium UBA8647]